MRSEYAKRDRAKWLVGAPSHVATIYDNGGKSADRYTVLYTKPFAIEDGYKVGRVVPGRGMSENPSHPQGVGLFITAQRGRHLGKKIRWCDLPAKCQQCVIQDGEE